jgi:hypothetical protein
MRALPSAVFGPVDRPPCEAHFVFPLSAAALHWTPVLFDVASHCKQWMRPPAMVMNEGALVCLLVMNYPKINIRYLLESDGLYGTVGN